MCNDVTLSGSWFSSQYWPAALLKALITSYYVLSMCALHKFDYKQLTFGYQLGYCNIIMEFQCKYSAILLLGEIWMSISDHRCQKSFWNNFSFFIVNLQFSRQMITQMWNQQVASGNNHFEHFKRCYFSFKHHKSHNNECKFII